MPDTAPISDDGTTALNEALATADVLRRVAGTVAIHLYESEYLEDGTYVCNTFIGEGLESLLGPLAGLEEPRRHGVFQSAQGAQKPFEVARLPNPVAQARPVVGSERQLRRQQILTQRQRGFQVVSQQVQAGIAFRRDQGHAEACLDAWAYRSDAALAPTVTPDPSEYERRDD